MAQEASIFKTDDDKRLVFGWASIAFTPDGEQLQDRQHDMIDPDDLEDAAYEYVLQFRDTGEEHIKGLRKKGKLVESCVFTEEKQRAIGIPAGSVPVGWWIGFHIDDDEAWEKIKNGTYKMFSIEGVAQREPIEKSAPIGCGVLVVKDGKLLTATRIDGKGRNRIGGPGGHIEQGETPEQAAKREAFEEFGITCNKLVPLGEADGGKYGVSACFLCTDFSGDPEADEEEMSGAEWLAPEDMDEEKLFLPFAQSLGLLEEKIKAQKPVAKTFDEVLKFNPYHDSKGRFSSSNGYASFTFRTKDPAKQHLADAAAARLKGTSAPQSGGAKPYADARTEVKNLQAEKHKLYTGLDEKIARANEANDRGDKKAQKQALDEYDADAQKINEIENRISDIVHNSAESSIGQELLRSDIDYNPVKRLDESLNSDEIISKVGAGYKENGSCSSAAFAYAANRNGLDVTDFRGGDSQEKFSRPSTIEQIANLPGVKSTTVENGDDFKSVQSLLKTTQIGKEYYLSTGKHAAIIKRDTNGFEYLELQSPKNNGFKTLTTERLKNRFKCQKSHTVAGRKISAKSTLIDTESLKGSKEFEHILGYINTQGAK